MSVIVLKKKTEEKSHEGTSSIYNFGNCGKLHTMSDVESGCVPTGRHQGGTACGPAPGTEKRLLSLVVITDKGKDLLS